jgi:hypothetical protein
VSPEIVYAPGKTPAQVAKICSTLLNSRTRVIVSGSSPGHEAEIRLTLPDTPLRPAGRALVVGSGEPVSSGGRVGAISAGTSELPIMKEAVAVAREMSVCSNRAATQVENTRIQQKTAPLRHPEFGLNEQTLEEVRKHEKTLRCLRMTEVTSSSLVGSTPKTAVLQVKYRQGKEADRISGPSVCRSRCQPILKLIVVKVRKIVYQAT